MARLTLLPGLRSPSLLPSPACDAVEFYLATLTEFVSFYLEVLDDSGDRPISKAKWLQDAEEDLRLRRTHDDHIRQFETWAGGHTSAGSQRTSIAEVDLGSRPDCMDDVVALAVSVCALGPEYALPFWSTAVDQEKDGEEIQKLVPSNALKGLERQQSEDDTLRAPTLASTARTIRTLRMALRRSTTTILKIWTGQNGKIPKIRTTTLLRRVQRS
jgi:hypothetical protein